MKAIGLEADYQRAAPLVYDPDSLRDYAETHSDQELLEGLEALGRYRAEHLLHCYTDATTPAEERKQALYDYCAVAMAEDLLAPDKDVHNPYDFPRWLVVAQSRMAEFIMEDIDNRDMLSDTQLFNDANPQLLHNLATSVSASIIPLDAYDDRVFVAGIFTGQIRPWVLPEIRADEFTLESGPGVSFPESP